MISGGDNEQHQQADETAIAGDNLVAEYPEPPAYFRCLGGEGNEVSSSSSSTSVLVPPACPETFSVSELYGGMLSAVSTEDAPFDETKDYKVALKK